MERKTSTLEDLWRMERSWETEENKHNADEGLWLVEGLGIYSMLLQKRPEDKFYKDSIQRITKQLECYIIKQSKEWQIIQIVCEKFHSIKANNVYVLYYLGYCAFMEQNWTVCAQYLNESMTLPGLDEDHTIKTLCGLAICMEKLGDYKKAVELLNKARVNCEPKMIFEVEMVRTQIECIIQTERPYECVVIGETGQENSRKQITSEEARRVITNSIEESLLLDMRHTHGYQFIGPHNTVRLQPKQASLLKYLLLSSEPKTRSAIKEELWIESKNPHVVKKYVSELKTLIKSCFETDHDIIENRINEGYKCTLGLPVIIIYHINPDGNI